MKQILAIVKPFRAQAVLDAVEPLRPAEVRVHEAKGYGRQKDQLPRYLGGAYDHVYLPKIAISLLVEDHQLETTLEAVTKAARTGRIGDGKIVVLPTIECIDF